MDLKNIVLETVETSEIFELYTKNIDNINTVLKKTFGTVSDGINVLSKMNHDNIFDMFKLYLLFELTLKNTQKNCKNRIILRDINNIFMNLNWKIDMTGSELETFGSNIKDNLPQILESFKLINSNYCYNIFIDIIYYTIEQYNDLYKDGNYGDLNASTYEFLKFEYTP